MSFSDNPIFVRPAYTYEWADAEEKTLRREDPDGNVAFVPADEGNLDYQHFISSEAVATPYVAPVTPEPTPEEKLAASGLTVAELQTLLGITPDPAV